MSKKVLGIVGSPRKKGNTDLLIDLVLDSARAAGGETEKVYLGDLNIGHCKECLYCHHADPKTCIQKDDMAALAAKMNEADVWVLGSPIFYWGPTGLFKNFMDRWYGFPLDFASKKIIFAVPSGDPDKQVARFFRGLVDETMAYEGGSLFAFLQAAGANDPGEVLSLADVVAEAKKIGADCVK